VSLCFHLLRLFPHTHNTTQVDLARFQPGCCLDRFSDKETALECGPGTIIRLDDLIDFRGFEDYQRKEKEISQYTISSPCTCPRLTVRPSG
jgi:hypothetical protein